MRRHILHVLTVAFAVILVSLWVYSLGRDLSSEETQAELKDDLAPFSVLKNNLATPPSW